MAKTSTTTATRSLAEIVEDFATISDSGALRYHQAKLTFEYVGNLDGKDATEAKEAFAKEANVALRRHHEKDLSVPGVTNLVNTWKYMTRANLDTNEETNKAIHQIAKAAFSLASQSFRKKEENYVIPAIEAILNGADPVKTFLKESSRLVADKSADREAKKTSPEPKDADEAITFDTIVAVLQVIPTVTDFTAEQKSTLRDLLASAGMAVAE